MTTYVKNLFTMLLVIMILGCNESPSQDQPKDKISEQKSTNTDQENNTGKAVLKCSIEVPGDYDYCDNNWCFALGGNGGLRFEVFKNKETGRIIEVRESGMTACQGDADYGWGYRLDEQGELSFGWNGGNPYLEEEFFRYKDGNIIEKVILPAYGSGNEIQFLSQTDGKITDDFVSPDTRTKWILEDIAKRIGEIKTCRLDTMDIPEAYKQAKPQMISALEKVIKTGLVCEEGYVFRKPTPADNEENVFITGRNVRLRAEPSTEGEVIGQVSYYDQGITVIGIGRKETIGDLGEHPWYRVSFYHSSKDKKEEGWIFGAFVGESIFEVE